MFKSPLLYITIFISTSSCISSSDSYKSFEKAEIIERIGNKDESPDWADGSKVMWEEGSDIVFANIVNMSGDARPDACMRAAALNGKAEMLKYLKQSISVSGQFDEAVVNSDPAFESLTAFLSQGDVSGAKVVEQYWERKLESNQEGERVLRLSCAAKVHVKKSTLAKQLRAATNPQKSGNTEIRNALIEAQTSFLSNPK